MNVLARIAGVAMAVAFVATTAVVMWLGLGGQAIADGALVFTIAVLAALGAIYLFIRSNAGSLEAFADRQERLPSLKRILFGQRSSG
ncbi:MAG: hypothetical protein JSR41_10795 [Proteobacteria bacterium]|nr:hypothetical protein [Pseudomonadota bacterium]